MKDNKSMRKVSENFSFRGDRCSLIGNKIPTRSQSGNNNKESDCQVNDYLLWQNYADFRICRIHYI